MQLNPVNLSRRLYCRFKAGRLNRLRKHLVKQQASIQKRQNQAADQAQALAQLRRFDPALNDFRRALRQDRATVEYRLAVVDKALGRLQLGVTA